MNNVRRPGDQDPEFGNGGVLSIGLDENIGGHIRHLPDGSYLIIGHYIGVREIGPNAQAVSNAITAATPNGLNYGPMLRNRVVTVKIDEYGKLDESYGNKGYAFLPSLEHEVRVTGSLVLSDNSVVLTLGIFDLDGGAFDSLNIVKVDAKGDLDKNFGDHGFHRPALAYEHSVASGIGVQEDGKILITAETILEYNVVKHVLMRIDERGRTDGTFGEGGFYYSRYDARGSLSRMKVDADGLIYVTGHVGDNMALFRFDQNGKPDDGFGDMGEFTYGNGDPGAFVANLAIREDGIYLAGAVGGLGRQIAAYAKLTLDGKLDQSFHNGIPLEIPLRSGNFGDYVLPLDSGQTIGVGTSFGIDGALTLSRIDENGVLDPEFGNEGSVLTDVPGYLVTSFAEQSGDKLLVGGWVLNPRPGEKTSFWVSRYLI